MGSVGAFRPKRAQMAVHKRSAADEFEADLTKSSGEDLNKAAKKRSYGFKRRGMSLTEGKIGCFFSSDCVD
jgi:hypothetical protein